MPRDNGKRKATDKPGVKPSNGKKIKPTARCENPFNANEVNRGHAKEYGDATVFPCGHVNFQEDHYHKCEPCQIVRTIMDAWENATIKITEHQEKTVPHLTAAGVFYILRKIGVSHEHVMTQPMDWNPYKPFVWKNDANGNTEQSEVTFADGYKNLKPGQKLMYTCAKLSLPEDFEFDIHNSRQIPVKHRELTMKSQMMEYVVLNALHDGLIDQNYVNKVIANYGVVPPSDDTTTGATSEELSAFSGVDMDTLYNSMQDLKVNPPNVRGVSVADFAYSPRRMYAIQQEEDGIAMGGELPYSRHQRLSSLQRQRMRTQGPNGTGAGNSSTEKSKGTKATTGSTKPRNLEDKYDEDKDIVVSPDGKKPAADAVDDEESKVAAV